MSGTGDFNPRGYASLDEAVEFIIQEGTNFNPRGYASLDDTILLNSARNKVISIHEATQASTKAEMYYSSLL